ncbi:type II toxin-antitoxin system RelE/ParE family toxin [Escherichia coli]
MWKVPGNWLFTPHFVLVYEVDSQWGKVYILRVLHTAQKWP